MGREIRYRNLSAVILTAVFSIAAMLLPISSSAETIGEIRGGIESAESEIEALHNEEDIEESERRRRELDETVAELEERKTELEGELSATIEKQLVSASSNDELRDAIIESVDDPLRKSLIRAAFTQIGVPYGYGSYSPGIALDCSGFTKWCYSQIGIDLPHWSVAQSRLVKPVAFDELQPGDLIFWVGTADGSLSGSHVAMWLGNNRLIHAGWSGIHVGPLYDGYTNYGAVL